MPEVIKPWVTVTNQLAKRLAGSGGGSSGTGGGSGGRGGGSDEEPFISQAIARLNREHIGADEDFLRELSDFAATGIARSRVEGISAERFQERWDRVIGAMIDYSNENSLRQLNSRAFDGIRTRLCPGFWPFC